MRRYVIWLGLGVAVAIPAAPGLAETRSGGDPKVAAARSYELAASVKELEIDLGGGRVAVSSGKGGKLQIEVRKLSRPETSPEDSAAAEQVQLVPLVEKGKATLKPSGPSEGRDSVRAVNFEVLVRAPAAWRATRHMELPRVKLATITGTMEVSGVRCALEVNTISGLVKLSDLRGTALVGTVEGNVCAEGCDWTEARLSSSGGDIEIGATRVAAGATLRLSSSVANLRVKLRRDSDCRIEADVTAGKVLTSPALGATTLQASGRSLRASLGEGRGLVKLRSTTGTIRVELEGASS